MKGTSEYIAFEYGYLKRFAFIQLSMFPFGIFVYILFSDGIIAIASAILLNAIVAYAFCDMVHSRRKCKNNDFEIVEIATVWSDLGDSYLIRRIDNDYSCDKCNMVFKSHDPKYCPKCGDKSIKIQSIRKTETYYDLTRWHRGFIIVTGGFYALEIWGIYAQLWGMLLISSIFLAILGGVILIDSGIGIIQSKRLEDLRMAYLSDGKKLRKIISSSVECTCNKCNNAIFFKDDKYCKNCGKEGLGPAMFLKDNRIHNL